MERRAYSRARKLIVPAVLAVSLAGTVSTTIGCKSTGKPVVDAGHGDAPTDTPVV